MNGNDKEYGIKAFVFFLFGKIENVNNSGLRVPWQCFTGADSLYWYHGLRRTQCMRMPASVRSLMEAASAARTVSFTDCIRF